MGMVIVMALMVVKSAWKPIRKLKHGDYMINIDIEKGDRAELIQAILEQRREINHLNRVISQLQRANNRYKKEKGNNNQRLYLLQKQNNKRNLELRLKRQRGRL